METSSSVKPNIEAISGQWRSEDMSLVNLVIPRESAYSCVFSIATAGCMQILDTAAGQPAHLRPQAAAIRQCDELERRFRFFKEQMEKVEVTPEPTPSVHDGARRDPNALQILDDRIAKDEQELREAASALESLQTELATINSQIAACESFKSLTTDTKSLSQSQGAKALMGVVPTAAVDQLLRLAYRASRGNALVKSVPLPDAAAASVAAASAGAAGAKPKDAKPLTAFLALTSSDMISKKLRAIAVTVGAQLISAEEVEQSGGLDKHKVNLEAMSGQLASTLMQTEARHFDIVSRIAQTYLEDARATQIDKTVSVALNLFSYSESFLKGQGWVPTNDIPRLREAIAEGHLHGQGASPIVEIVATHKLVPPTHFRTSKYMEVFQMIVNSYGTPHYKEINPAVFTIVTFPYLFGIMFGDMGHGVLLALFAAALIVFEPKLVALTKTNEMFSMIFTGRYLLFLMGLFAVYIGILYNDYFGVSVGLFKSGYDWPLLPEAGGPGGVVHPNFPSGHPSVKPDEPYAFGLDVAWAETENKLEFYNSVKMKSAVVVGVVQMTLGIVLSFMNKLYKKSYREIFFLVIPEIVFLTCTFGYMSLLIIIKWCTTWENTNEAPSLLETMTNFFLSPGDVKVELYSGQAGIQTVLLLVAFAMAPVMLLVTPLLERFEHKKKVAARSGAYASVEDGGLVPAEGEDEDEHFDFGEVMIHYVIHTIEFVLGCVSNTASYLRLWALSLAHAQLSEVFFNFAFCLTLGMDTGLGVFTVVGTAVWLGATIGVLLGMESLSAFLHSLRLHWVEFQNKFYAADGVEFLPLTLPEE